jgi:hypothetical protein
LQSTPILPEAQVAPGGVRITVCAIEQFLITFTTPADSIDEPASDLGAIQAISANHEVHAYCAIFLLGFMVELECAFTPVGGHIECPSI